MTPAHLQGVYTEKWLTLHTMTCVGIAISLFPHVLNRPCVLSITMSQMASDSDAQLDVVSALQLPNAPTEIVDYN